MKKLFTVILSFILIVGMWCVPALADTVYENCEHYGQTVTATEDGYVNILFSNGYRGFCINKGWEGADSGDTFTVDNMGLAVNNNDSSNISDYLKVMFVDHFNDIFTVETALTCELKNENQIQRIAWYFSNDYSAYSDDLTFAQEIITTAQNRSEAIPDHGYTVKVNDTTLATFDFHALKSSGYGYQNFWTYKVTLASYPAPVITSPTENKTIDVAAGNGTQLSVTATNAESYQWQVDSGSGSFSNISGATTAAYTTPNTTAGNKDYKYRCVVTNTAGSDTSPVFSINMIEAPQFTSPTENVGNNVYAGQTSTLNVTATGSPTYQWQVDKGDGNGFKNIEEATAPSYTTPVITEENSAYKYRCVASNLAGSDTSPVFSINMIGAPTFTKPETSTEVQLDERQSTELNVTATNAESYQWQIDSGDGFKNIEGATSATYTLPAVTEENSGDKYRCVASNPVGSSTSFEFTLKVNNIDPPVITEGTKDNKTDIKQGEDFVLSVLAEEGATYQWQVDSGDGFKDIENATNPEYTAPTDKAGTAKYRCVVSNENGETLSGIFTVNVQAPVFIPKTDAIPNIGLWVAVMLLSLGTLAIILRKRLVD